jgi:hypothetical protein
MAEASKICVGIQLSLQEALGRSARAGGNYSIGRYTVAS